MRQQTCHPCVGSSNAICWKTVAHGRPGELEDSWWTAAWPWLENCNYMFWKKMPKHIMSMPKPAMVDHQQLLSKSNHPARTVLDFSCLWDSLQRWVLTRIHALSAYQWFMIPYSHAPPELMAIKAVCKSCANAMKPHVKWASQLWRGCGQYHVGRLCASYSGNCSGSQDDQRQKAQKSGKNNWYQMHVNRYRHTIFYDR